MCNSSPGSDTAFPGPSELYWAMCAVYSGGRVRWQVGLPRCPSRSFFILQCGTGTRRGDIWNTDGEWLPHPALCTSTLAQPDQGLSFFHWHLVLGWTSSWWRAINGQNTTWMSNGVRTRLIPFHRLLMYGKVRVVFGLYSSLSGSGQLHFLHSMPKGVHWVDWYPRNTGIGMLWGMAMWPLPHGQNMHSWQAMA